MRRWVLSAALMLVAVPASAKDLYVNNSGSPTCSDATTYANNDEDSPWCTIGRAAWGSTTRTSPNTSEAVQAGDTVYVLAGTYTTTGTELRQIPAYNPANSGSGSARITFEAVGTVILTQSGTGPVIGSLTRTNVTWRGFTINEIDALGASDTGPVVVWDSMGTWIENLTINGYDAGAMGNNHNGIRLEYSTGTVIRNNVIFNVLNYGTKHMNGAGIMAYYSSGAIIEHNRIYDCGSGIFIKGGDNQSFTVRYNEVYETAYGILIQHTDSTVGQHKIYQNISRNNEFGIAARQYSFRTWIVNNTVVNNSSAGIQGINWEDPLENLWVYNNIVIQPNNEHFNGGLLHVPNELFIDRNWYHSSLRWSINGIAYSSLATWRTALGGCPGSDNECDSATGDPGFVDASEHDYRLQDESPVRTLGRTITAIHGSDGETIPAGAYITGEEIIGPTEGETPTPTDPVRWRVRFRAGSLELGSLAVALAWWLRRRRQA